jgi:hypothetical protein
MRKLPAVLGSVLACTLCFIGGDSRVVHGDAPTPVPERPPGDVDPFQAYAQGAGALSYDSMSTPQQDEVDTIQATTDFAPKADAIKTLDRATSETIARAKAEVSAGAVGLSGTEQDGVVP